VNKLDPGSGSPEIRIFREADGVVIEQHRPAVLSSLTGLPVEQALQMVPRLLPICGTAQSVAASRAVEAARGELPDPLREVERQHRLWREQAMSAGWRLAVDWPDLLDKPRALIWLKVLRNSADNAACASVLGSAVPELEAVWSLGDLRAWADSSSNNAAAMLGVALAQDQPLPASGQRLAGQELAAAARAALADASFNPQAPHEQAMEVGPLAMGRDPLIAANSDRLAASTAGRLQAQVLDMRIIIRNLQSRAREPAADPRSWTEGPGTGTGCAETARGPVFHRVALDQSDRVSAWQALAPTDWHFARRGPVALALGGDLPDNVARLAVTGFDPCAPWSLVGSEER
jgi:hypothetical protein